MATLIDYKYHKEKLADWERKSLEEKYSKFSFFKKSNWLSIGFILITISFLAFISPVIPPRYGWGRWTPPTTIAEYGYRVKGILIFSVIAIILVWAYANTRNKIDLKLGIKWIANFRVRYVLNFRVIKLLLLNGWRIFCVRKNQQYFDSVLKGQIITIKRTATFRLIDYYIRNENINPANQNQEKQT